MTRLQQIIYVVNFFSTGILLPVLNLILLEKGSNLQTLPLLLAIYSLTVLCMELPSGIFADIYGRKAAFLLSCVLQFVSFCILLVANNFIFLIFVIAFFGLGRAFASGSIDALIIDQALALQGNECLAKVTARLAVLEAGGLALGGIAGGFIPEVTGTYTGNIVLRLALTLLMFTLCLAFVKEQPLNDMKQQKERTSLVELLGEGKKIIFSTPVFTYIFIGVFFTGFFLFTLETYWQPAFMKISAIKNNTWVLGFITFAGFFAVVSGNTISQQLLNRLKNSWWSIYNICRILMSAVIFAFAFQKSTAGFISGYAGIYLLLGTANVAESTLVNKFTPNNMRASVLSLSSFITQIGGFCASLFSSIAILQLNFSGIWIAAGVLLGSYAIVLTAVTKVSGVRDYRRLDAGSQL